MRKVFWENPYQSNLDTTIAKVLGSEILLAETIAYSFSGGQESDIATLSNIPILSSRMEANDIYYLLPENHGLKPGDLINMQINWPRRNRLMRLHFACELILVIINRIIGKKPSGIELRGDEIDHLGIRKTGAHIAEDKARIDFQLDQNISTFFPEILATYENIINSDLAIQTGYIDEPTQERYWRIAGLATVPCGGTHVKSTAEVGMVNLKRDRPGKGIERIKISLVNAEPTSSPENT